MSRRSFWSKHLWKLWFQWAPSQNQPLESPQKVGGRVCRVHAEVARTIPHSWLELRKMVLSWMTDLVLMEEFLSVCFLEMIQQSIITCFKHHVYAIYFCNVVMFGLFTCTLHAMSFNIVLPGKHFIPHALQPLDNPEDKHDLTETLLWRT